MISRAILGMLLFSALGPVRAAADLRLGGNIGFGMTIRKQAGLFDWDWDSAREDTTLAELAFGYTPVPALAAFVRFGARIDAAQDGDTPAFALREASLVYLRPIGADSLGLRLFARQPSALWLDHGLGAPIDPLALGEDVQGLRAVVHGRRLLALLIAADGRSWFEDTEPDVGSEQLILLRLRGDATRTPGLRIGATYMRQVPAGDPASRTVLDRDQFGFDARALLYGVQFQVDCSFIHEEKRAAFFPVEGVAKASQPHRRIAGEGPLTDAMPSDAALRAEIRAPRLGSVRWGWLGFAPSYRAVGSTHTTPLLGPQPSLGSPSRGYEGYRIEAWYELAQWPVWLRHAYDQEEQFADADRRVIRQESEIEAWLVQDVRARVLFTQTQATELLRTTGEHHDDVVVELGAAQGSTRMRAQWGALDIDQPDRRDVFALQGAVRMSARMQAIGRVTWARTPGNVQSSLVAALQYWHLPQFEVALQYGAGWIGDRADPVLDGDAMDADGRDLVQLHLRGWF